MNTILYNIRWLVSQTPKWLWGRKWLLGLLMVLQIGHAFGLATRVRRAFYIA